MYVNVYTQIFTYLGIYICAHVCAYMKMFIDTNIFTCRASWSPYVNIYNR